MVVVDVDSHWEVAKFERGQHPYQRIDYKSVKNPVAEDILNTCVILAVNENYTDQDLDETARGIERVVNHFLSKK